MAVLEWVAAVVILASLLILIWPGGALQNNLPSSVRAGSDLSSPPKVCLLGVKQVFMPAARAPFPFPPNKSPIFLKFFPWAIPPQYLIYCHCWYYCALDLEATKLDQLGLVRRMPCFTSLSIVSFKPW